MSKLFKREVLPNRELLPNPAGYFSGAIVNVGVRQRSLAFMYLPQKAHTCPACGAGTGSPFGRDTFLHLRKRCNVCSCGKRFAEKNPFLPRYYRATSRLIASVIEGFRKVISAMEIASRYNLSVTTAIRYFGCENYRSKELPEVLSIDEFKRNVGGEKYQSIFTHP